MNRWKSSSNTVHNVGYHIIWCPKYRRKVLLGDVESRLRDLLHEISAEIGVVIERMELMPDHVHLFVKTHPGNAPHYIVQQLKGRTSRGFKIGIFRAPLEAALALDEVILSGDNRSHFGGDRQEVHRGSE